MIQPISFQPSAVSLQAIPAVNKTTPQDTAKASLKDVVAESEYGDTVQVSSKGQERYEREIAAAKESSKEEPLEEEEKESSDDSDSKPVITSLAGYTEAQLKQLYLQGDISKYDYESRVEQKEELLSNEMETNEKNSEDTTKGIQKMDSIERSMDAIDNAFSPDSSDRLSSEQRVDIMNALGTNDSNQQKTTEAFQQWQRSFNFLLT